ncbi:MAG: acyl-CoA dehydrogenase, partial [Hyphomicrobiaceae bacterium]|nr:acyl-CoA dehydrogenase [Hyphomicrobiaceae bacterium]
MASESLVGDTARRMFADLCDPQALNQADGNGWVAPAWNALEKAGLLLAWVPEALGGGGAGLA